MLSNYTWSTEGCYLSSVLNTEAECSCNHLSQFSLRKFAASAAVDSNIGATVDIDNLEDFDLNTSAAPLICLGVIYGTYIAFLVIF